MKRVLQENLNLVRFLQDVRNLVRILQDDINLQDSCKKSARLLQSLARSCKNVCQKLARFVFFPTRSLVHELELFLENCDMNLPFDSFNSTKLARKTHRSIILHESCWTFHSFLPIVRKCSRERPPQLIRDEINFPSKP